MPSTFKSWSNSSRTVLIGRMQRFLLQEALDIASGKKDKVKAEADEALLYSKYFERVRAQAYSSARRHDTGKYHPSSFSQCKRAVWFKIMGAPTPLPYDAESEARSAMIFKTGDMMHARLQMLLKRMGVLEAYEKPIENLALNLEGHCDAVVNLDGVRYVVDFKTINERGFAALRAGPKKEHREQINHYMRELGIDRAIILYENKNTQLWKEFVVRLDPGLTKQVERDVKLLNKCRATKTPPPKEGDSPSCDVCQWCAYAATCHDPKSLNKFLATLNKGASHATVIARKSGIKVPGKVSHATGPRKAVGLASPVRRFIAH